MAEPVTEVALRPPAPRPSSRYVLAAAGLGVSGAVAWLAVRKVDPTDFVAAFRQSDWWYVVPAAAALTAAVALRLLRWRLLFAAGRRPPIRPLGRAFLIGYLFNSILPARPGELARAVALRREVGTPVAEALATTAAERLYDVAALLALLFVGALFVPAPSAVDTAAVAAAGFVGVGLVAAVVVGRRDDRLEGWVERAVLAVPRVPRATALRWSAGIVAGLVSLRDRRVAARAAVLTLASWVVLVLSAWALLPAFHLRLGFAAALVIVVAANLTLLVPASPGGLGVFEAATVAVLASFAVDRSAALSYAVALHGLNLFPYVVAGAFALFRHTQFVRARDRP